MKKFIVSLSIVLFFACSSDDSISEEENIIISAPNSTSEASNNTESDTSNTSSSTTSDTSSTSSNTSTDTFTVTILSSEGGTVSGDSGEYDLDSEIQLIASPNEGYFFSGWQGVDEDEETISLTVNSNIEITATFLSLPSIDVIDNIDTSYAANFKIFTKSQEGDLDVSFSSEGGFESLNITSSYGSVNYTQPNEGELGGEILINYTALEINNPNTDITIAGEDYLEFELTDLYGNIITKSVTLKTQPEPIFKDYLKSSHDNQVTRLHKIDFNLIRETNDKADRYYCNNGTIQTPGLVNDGIISVAILDINGDGYEDFIIPSTYFDKPNELTSRKGEYEIYMYLRGEYVYFEGDEFFQGTPPSSFIARKALVGDFDNDGDGDIFFSCTGMDLNPYPREREPSLLFVNNYSETGLFEVVEIDDYASSHEATAADFDNDGDLDIFSIGYVERFDGQYHEGILENQGGNNFVRKNTFTGTNHLNYRSSFFNAMNVSEASDINGDGFIDIVIGGDYSTGISFDEEFLGMPRLMLGNSSFLYNTDQYIKIPNVQGFNLILDVDFYDIDNNGTKEIIVMRSGDQLLDDGSFNQTSDQINSQIGESYAYGGYYIQICELKNNTIVDVSDLFIDDNFYRAVNNPWNCDFQSDWIRWIVIQDYDNDGNIDIFNPLIYFWGEGHESLRRWEWNGSRFTRINP